MHLSSENRFQSFPFKRNVHRYNEGDGGERERTSGGKRAGRGGGGRGGGGGDGGSSSGSAAGKHAPPKRDTGGAVYKLNAVDPPQLESAWLQPLEPMK